MATKAISALSTSYATLQAGDTIAVDRGGVTGKTTYTQLVSEVGSDIGTTLGNGLVNASSASVAHGLLGIFDTVAQLIADTGFTYSNAAEGDLFFAQGYTFRTAAAGASDHHFTTAGGLKLYREDLENITVTVGSGGDYSTINAALEYLSGQRRGHKTGTGITGVTATISLLTGFTMSEQVILRGVDMGWVTITSVDPTVTIARSALTVRPTGSNNYAAFTGYENATLPNIAALFTMNTTGTATERGGVFVWKNSRVYVASGCGVKNCGGRGIHVSDSSSATARSAEFDGAGDIGARVSNSSSLAADGINLRNAGSIGIAMSGGSRAQIEDSFMSGSVMPFSIEGSTCFAKNATADGCTVAGQVYDAGRLSANGIAITNSSAGALIVYQGGHAAISNGDLGGATTDALVVQDASSVEAESTLFDGAGQDGARFDHGSRGNLNGANVSSAGRYGIAAINGSYVSAYAVNAASAGTFGYYVDKGGNIAAFDPVGGTFSKTKNTFGADGLIWSNP